MNTFNERWQAEEEKMRQQGADDEVVLHVMRNIAEMAWDAATNRAVGAIEERIKKTDLAVLKAEKEQDEENVIYLRSVSFVLGLLVSEIKETKNDQ